jgi:putative chitinase
MHEGKAMPYDRKHFFDGVRASLFRGNLRQSQVDGMNYLLAVWERHFEAANPRDGTKWLAYCLATAFHETAETMEPIEEYGKGKGKSYGQPAGPYNQCYYGRGYVQLTWSDNYEKAQRFMKDRYKIEAAIHKEPHRALEHEIAALVLYDGSEHGWFTGVGLSKYFNGTTEDPVNARRIINGTDRAETIAGYYRKFLAALKQVPGAPPAEVDLPGLPAEPPMPDPSEVEDGEITRRDQRRERQDERR